MDTTTERLANALRLLVIDLKGKPAYEYPVFAMKCAEEAIAAYDAALKQQPRHEGAEDARSYADDKRAQDCKRALEGLSQDALDGGWCFAGIEKYCKGLELRIAQLIREGAEDARDAARYRWLRDKQAYVAIHPHHQDLPKDQRTGWTIRLVNGRNDSFAAAIDAAIASERSGT